MSGLGFILAASSAVFNGSFAAFSKVCVIAVCDTDKGNRFGFKHFRSFLSFLSFLSFFFRCWTIPSAKHILARYKLQLYGLAFHEGFNPRITSSTCARWCIYTGLRLSFQFADKKILLLFFFGFLFIPFPFIFPTSTQQLPSVQRAGTEPVIFNLYVCLGVFVSGFFAIPFYSLSKNEVGITGVSVFGERLASSLRHRTHLDVQYTCRF